jgi:hypothetical protein
MSTSLCDRRALHRLANVQAITTHLVCLGSQVSREGNPATLPAELSLKGKDHSPGSRDLDAVFIPTDTVRQAAAAVAQHRGLTEDWRNDAVKGFLPGPDPDAQRFTQAIC